MLQPLARDEILLSSTCSVFMSNISLFMSRSLFSGREMLGRRKVLVLVCYFLDPENLTLLFFPSLLFSPMYFLLWQTLSSLDISWWHLASTTLTLVCFYAAYQLSVHLYCLASHLCILKKDRCKSMSVLCCAWIVLYVYV